MSELLKLKVIGEHPELLAPYGNYVTIALIKAEKETIGGLVLPDELVARDRQSLARVIAVGPGQKNLNSERVPMFTQVGDLILILKHAPIEIKVGGASFHVVAEGDIVGKLNESLLAELLVTAEADAAQQKADRDAAAAAHAESQAVAEGQLQQETPDGMVRELPSGLLLVTGKA